MRSAIGIGICVLAFELIVSAPGRSADIAAVQRRVPPDLATAGTRAVEAGTLAADGSPSYPGTWFGLASQPELNQSAFIFGGRTNSGNLGSTLLYGLGAPKPKFYDNYILGGAYQRDFFQLNSGILIGAEVGLADRFGHYKVCCDTIVYSDALAHSAELWGGVSFRHQGIALFDTVRISPGVVFGLSAISSPIGQEGEHQIVHQGSARVLFYLGFDLAFALANFPNTELVFRIHHRSGAFGTLGGVEGRQQRQCSRDTSAFLIGRPTRGRCKRMLAAKPSR